MERSFGAPTPFVPGDRLLAVHILLGLVFDTAWALTAGAACGQLARDPRRLPRLGATGGEVMIGVGGTIALSDRQL